VSAAFVSKLSFRCAVMVLMPWADDDSRKSMPSALAITRSSGVEMKPRTRSALAPT
jgi:hypothetical protein